MKRIIALALSLIVIFSVSVTAFAADASRKVPDKTSDSVVLEDCMRVDTSSYDGKIDGSPLERVKYPSLADAEALGFKEGVTKVVFHWWGVTVYLSRSTVRWLGLGITIAGIWIPEAVVTKVLATLGVVAQSCPGGIRFDYYVFMPVANIWNVRFQ